MKHRVLFAVLVLLVLVFAFACKAKAPAEKPVNDTQTGGQNASAAQQNVEKHLLLPQEIAGITASIDTQEYPLSNITDGRQTTVWVASGKPSGIGDWVQFSFNGTKDVQDLVITPGFDMVQNGKDLFTANNSLKRAMLTFADGTTQTVEFSGDERRCTIPVLKQTSSVRLTISEVFPGTKWKDTCIGEMSFNVR